MAEIVQLVPKVAAPLEGDAGQKARALLEEAIRLLDQDIAAGKEINGIVITFATERDEAESYRYLYDGNRMLLAGLMDYTKTGVMYDTD